MIRMLSMLCVAAVMGVTCATSLTCGVGLFNGTGVWCGLPFFWFVGFPVAVLSALVFGFPLALLYRRLGLSRWWQFGAGAVVASVPFWYELAQPFESIRWQQSGLYDSLNYLGSGLFAGLSYWWITRKFGLPDPRGQPHSPT